MVLWPKNPFFNFLKLEKRQNFDNFFLEIGYWYAFLPLNDLILFFDYLLIKKNGFGLSWILNELSHFFMLKMAHFLRFTDLTYFFSINIIQLLIDRILQMIPFLLSENHKQFIYINEYYGNFAKKVLKVNNCRKTQ